MIRLSLFALISGLVAGFASWSYGMVFSNALLVDYSAVIPTTAIFISSLIGCILATLGYAGLTKFLPNWGEFIFGMLFALLSIASIIGVFGAQLPDSDDESFYYLIFGYAIPMHFFPFMVWYALKPLFTRKWRDWKYIEWKRGRKCPRFLLFIPLIEPPVFLSFGNGNPIDLVT